MSDKIHIRLANPVDTAAIAEFNIAMARETENLSLKPEVIHQGVCSLMAQPHLGFYIVAEADDHIAGCLMITNEWSDWRNGLFWWIQSVYVLPQYRRQGIYRRMYNYIKETAAENSDIIGFRLYVDKENRPAQKTYQNLGMEESDYRLYEEMKS